ncbi:hypothetical protein Fcan01_21901 [Folsomia candida]|uniref:F-box domain-containing protein n=1 Tax=Folsomia candida TaxID=158441 RepID=A0A226DEM3_FOLCA|nr:hypothetical protein Fcan01_21901 [Folsomia candida]
MEKNLYQCLQHVFSKLPFADKLNARLVSQDFNALFTTPHFLKDCLLLVNGNETEDDEIYKFLVNTPVGWINLELRNFNLGEIILDKEFSFTRVSRRWQFTLKSLTLKKVEILLGRFMELVSFLYVLTELSLEEVPDLYKKQNPLEFLNWNQFIQPFTARLRSLKKLSLIEQGSDALDDDRALWYFLNNSTSLEHLTIYTTTDEESEFPKASIVRAMGNCQATLKELFLSGNSGSYITDESKFVSFWASVYVNRVKLNRLETLSLNVIPMDHFALVKHRLENLTTLEMTNMAFIHYQVLHDFASCVPFLKNLTIEHCNLEEGVISQIFGKCQFLSRVTFRENRVTSGNIIDEYVKFFKSGSDVLEHVEVGGIPSEPVFMKTLLNYVITPDDGDSRKLQTLEISHFDGFYSAQKDCLFYLADCLTSLDFSSTDLDNSWLFIFSELKALESIYLSNTKVGMDMLLKLFELPNLVTVDLNQTKDQYDDYQALIAINASKITLVDPSNDEDNDDEEEQEEQEEEDEEDDDG